jgi:hypothetical protein
MGVGIESDGYRLIPTARVFRSVKRIALQRSCHRNRVQIQNKLLDIIQNIRYIYR